jgi:hypothetical protein
MCRPRKRLSPRRRPFLPNQSSSFLKLFAIMTPLEVALTIATLVFGGLFIVFIALYIDIVGVSLGCGGSILKVTSSTYTQSKLTNTVPYISDMANLSQLKCFLRLASLGDPYAYSLGLAGQTVWVRKGVGITLLDSVQAIQIDSNYTPTVIPLPPPTSEIVLDLHFVYLVDLPIPIVPTDSSSLLQRKRRVATGRQERTTYQ